MDKKYNIFSMLDRLTNGDITKDEEIFELEYTHCLNRLMYWSAKDKYIEKVNKAIEDKAKGIKRY